MPYKHLSMDERNVIYRMKFLGHSQAEIARCLGRHPSTIGRELQRNSAFDGRYSSGSAQAQANARCRARMRRPKTGNPELMRYVERKLGRRWSPEQIAGRLREVGSAMLPGATISHATIYRWIWSDPERAHRIKPLLRVACKPRRKPYGKASKRGQIPGRVSIDERAKTVEERSRLGDWEGDTVVGKGHSGYVATCVDRRSRYLLSRKLADASAKAMNGALHGAMRRLPAGKRQTLTVDNGREFAKHERLDRLLGLAVYFAHPYSSWQRGTNENTNGLLRQYLPKKIPFTQLTEWRLASYVLQLNQRPRKCLNYRTPAEVFHERHVALTM